MDVPDILVVEDDRAIRDMLNFVLAQNHFNIIESNDAESAQNCILQKQPNLILLDWMLPGQSGIDFARGLRADVNTRDIPIIMITAKGEEIDKVSGLNSGADDYITKPIKPKVLVSKIKSLLRRLKTRSDSISNTPNVLDGLVIDREAYKINFKGLDMVLPRKEFELLYLLASRPGKVFNREVILEKIWGKEVVVGGRTIDVHIRKLREKLGDSKFKTIKGVGYKFQNQ